MGRCRAHQCPEDDLPDERAYCEVHWMFLPAEYREWLAEAYGTIRWKQVLAECSRKLRQVEASAPRERS